MRDNFTRSDDFREVIPGKTFSPEGEESPGNDKKDQFSIISTPKIGLVTAINSEGSFFAFTSEVDEK